MNRLRNLNKTTRSNLITYGIVVAVFVILQALMATNVLSFLMRGLLVPICAYVCMAISLNLVVGYSGELSLGHASFMSVGAFSGIIVSAMLKGTLADPFRLLIAIIVAGVFAGVAGLVIGMPVMRLRGDYLAIVTLAFGEIIKNLLNNTYIGLDGSGLHLSMKSAQDLGMEGGRVLLNGPQGATGVDKLSTFFAGFLLVLFTLTVALNLVHSRTGRAIMAVRDNRIAAESVGINTTKYRLIAFVVSAVLAGMAGALYAMNFSTVVPKKFDFNTSIFILVFVVLGGIGHIRGGMIAAALLTILPEELRVIGGYRMLIYSIVLIAVMLLTHNETVLQKMDDFKKRWRRRRAGATLEPSSEGGDAHE